MIVVPERLIAGLMSENAVFEAIEGTFGAMVRGEARNFPIIREVSAMRMRSMASNRVSTRPASCLV